MSLLSPNVAVRCNHEVEMQPREFLWLRFPRRIEQLHTNLHDDLLSPNVAARKLPRLHLPEQTAKNPAEIAK